MNKSLRNVLYLGFLGIGLVSNIVGPMLPALRMAIPMSFAQSGLLLAGMWPGMILAVLVGGKISDKYGDKLLLIFGSIALASGMLGVMVSGNHSTLLISLIIAGLGFGAYEIAINVICAVANDSNKGNALNHLHFFFGFGAIFGPILATVCLKFFSSWRLVFGLASLLPIVVMIIIRPLTIEKQHSNAGMGNNRLFREGLLWICGIFIFFYVGLELSIQGWIAVFLEKTAPDSLIPASLAASFFWVTLTAGRLVSGKMADRIGLPRFLALVSLSGSILALVWIFSHLGLTSLLMVFLLGILLAGVFPTQMAFATSLYPGMAGVVTAFIQGFASSAVFAIPSAFGKIADWRGITQLPAFIFVLATLMFVFAICQLKLAERRKV